MQDELVFREELECLVDVGDGLGHFAVCGLAERRYAPAQSALLIELDEGLGLIEGELRKPEIHHAPYVRFPELGAVGVCDESIDVGGDSG